MTPAASLDPSLVLDRGTISIQGRGRLRKGWHRYGDISALVKKESTKGRTKPAHQRDMGLAEQNSFRLQPYFTKAQACPWSCPGVGNTKYQWPKGWEHHETGRGLVAPSLVRQIK